MSRNSQHLSRIRRLFVAIAGESVGFRVTMNQGDDRPVRRWRAEGRCGRRARSPIARRILRAQSRYEPLCACLFPLGIATSSRFFALARLHRFQEMNRALQGVCGVCGRELGEASDVASFRDASSRGDRAVIMSCTAFPFGAVGYQGQRVQGGLELKARLAVSRSRRPTAGQGAFFLCGYWAPAAHNHGLSWRAGLL